MFLRCTVIGLLSVLISFTNSTASAKVSKVRSTVAADLENPIAAHSVQVDDSDLGLAPGSDVDDRSLLGVGAATAYYIERLKHIPADYGSDGTICERVAELELAAKYPPPQYRVESSLQYHTGFQTLGELDVVVTNGRGDGVIIVEVKCWNKPGPALKKAREQQDRFVEVLRTGKRLSFIRNNQPVNGLDLSRIDRFYIMGPKDTKILGYDMELPLTLNALMNLRSEMIQCQNRGECARH